MEEIIMTDDLPASSRTVISKAALILMTFLEGDVHSMTEIARSTGLPASTAHRLARELAVWGILDRTEEGHYRVGSPLRLIGSAIGPGLNLEELGPLVLRDLSEVTHAEVRLGVLRNRDVAYIEKLPGRRPVSGFSTNELLPAHASAMGKALLAFSLPAVVEVLIAQGLPSYTPFTLTAPDRLRRALEVTRLSRMAVCRWELEPDRCALAVPVFGPGGCVVAAIEIRVNDLSGTSSTIQPLLRIAGRSLTRELAASGTVRSHHRTSRQLVPSAYVNGRKLHPAEGVPPERVMP
jgi:DNA-binding IclR family transcriptional regulator